MARHELMEMIDGCASYAYLLATNASANTCKRSMLHAPRQMESSTESCRRLLYQYRELSFSFSLILSILGTEILIGGGTVQSHTYHQGVPRMHTYKVSQRTPSHHCRAELPIQSWSLHVQSTEYNRMFYYYPMINSDLQYSWRWEYQEIALQACGTSAWHMIRFSDGPIRV